jgi:hypothetical protein
VSVRSAIVSLALVTKAMLTGRWPGVQEAELEDAAPSPAIPAPLRTVLGQALDAAGGYATAGEFVQALREAMTKPAPTAPERQELMARLQNEHQRMRETLDTVQQLIQGGLRPRMNTETALAVSGEAVMVQGDGLVHANDWSAPDAPDRCSCAGCGKEIPADEPVTAFDGATT